MKSKLITTIGFIFFIFLNLSIDLKAKEECFEGLSRSIFKFNMAFDEGILEPIAKGYNKLPQPLKTGTNNLLLTFLPCFLFQIICYKATLTN